MSAILDWNGAFNERVSGLEVDVVWSPITNQGRLTVSLPADPAAADGTYDRIWNELHRRGVASKRERYPDRSTRAITVFCTAAQLDDVVVKLAPHRGFSGWDT